MTDFTERIDTRRVPAFYILFMATWVYGFAAARWDPPALLVFVLLLLPAVVHFGVGYLLGRW